jgi:hypothetical protein
MSNLHRRVAGKTGRYRHIPPAGRSSVELPIQTSIFFSRYYLLFYACEHFAGEGSAPERANPGHWDSITKGNDYQPNRQYKAKRNYVKSFVENAALP